MRRRRTEPPRREVVGAAARGGAGAGWRWPWVTPNLKESGGHRDFTVLLQGTAAGGKTPSVSWRRRMASPVRVVSPRTDSEGCSQAAREATWRLVGGSACIRVPALL
jgi:hypothetical protein